MFAERLRGIFIGKRAFEDKGVGMPVRIAVNGMNLNVETSGSGDGPAVLLLHGFSRDAREWEPIVAAFDAYRTVRVDLIGHGRSESPPDPGRYSMAHAVDDLLALLHHLDIERTALLGYSMGARVALHLALEAPQLLWAVVLESASPGIEDAGDRMARAEGDAALAASIERDGIEAFADRWQSQPLFASQASLPEAVLAEQRRRRLENSPRGLANSLRGMGQGMQAYLMPRLHEIEAPTLFVAGSLDGRYAGLAPRMAAEVAGAEHAIIADAGHTVHLEQPEAFGQIVGRFLAQHRPQTQER